MSALAYEQKINTELQANDWGALDRQLTLYQMQK
jgi:hypothetical protein